MTKRQYEEQRPLVKETEHNETGPERDILNPAREIAGLTVSLEWVLVLSLLHIVLPHKARQVLGAGQFPFLAALQFKRKLLLLLVAEYLTPMCLSLATVLWNGIAELRTIRGWKDGIYDHGGNCMSVDKASSSATEARSSRLLLQHIANFLRASPHAEEGLPFFLAVAAICGWQEEQ